MYKKKRQVIIAMTMVMVLLMSGCVQKNKTAEESTTVAETETVVVSRYAGMTAKEIVAKLSLEEKAAQMVQPAVYNVTTSVMKNFGYGSILSDLSYTQTVSQWKKTVLDYQKAALDSSSGIPYLYGTDAVHGVNKALGTVIFPQNINVGAAADENLAYKMGLAVGDEEKMTGMLWNFAPCVATDIDPRWGRTYESYSSDPELVKKLSTSYAKGLMENGILPCAKHFFGDGTVDYGTGEGDYLIDRGDATLTDAEIAQQLSIYQSLIDSGVSSIMVSHSSLNGLKMHENKKYITDVLKGQMGFKGFVVSDWESIHYISKSTLKDQVITSINSGIDMLMEPQDFDKCKGYIIEGVNEGSISQDRVDDAVTRIVQVKQNLGLFDDPMQKNLTTTQSDAGSSEYRDIARQLVEKSMVLLKNDGNILPLKKGGKVYICGPASNDTGVLCGGWTIDWGGKTDLVNKGKVVKDGKTILDGFKELAKEYDFEIITDPKEAFDADIAILCVGEKPYAEWTGDTEDLSLTGKLGLPGNADAIKQVKDLNIPTVTCVVAGRNVLIQDYLADWDAVVMCYLPGSEGNGVSNVLAGKAPFSGKLPMPWYKTTNDIGTGNYLFAEGFGLTTK